MRGAKRPGNCGHPDARPTSSFDQITKQDIHKVISALLQYANESRPKVLCLGAHCDDIEIGCGGTLLKIMEDRPEAEVHWVIFSANDTRRDETRIAAREIIGESNLANIHFFDFRDGFLPYQGAEVKESLNRLSQEIHPELIFSHHRADAHQDHRLISELTQNHFRDHLILEYEIPKYDGDLGQPNLYVPLDSSTVNRKIRILLNSFSSQSAKHWFSDETFRSMMHLRGIESGREHQHAEAFYSHKLVCSP